MPIYTYKCHQCGKEFEYKQSINDKPLTHCPENICKEHNHAQAEVSRVISKNIGLVFKGSGFYLTDYAKKNSSASASSSAASNKDNPHNNNTENNSKADTKTSENSSKEKIENKSA